MEDFLERIDVNIDFDEIVLKICEKCNIKDYLSSKIVEAGYEDFNFIIDTKEKKYFVKIFHKGRTDNDCKNYIDRIKLSNMLDINTPKVICFDSIKIDDKELQFVVFEYIDGKSFLDLEEMPNEGEIKEIIRQMANIHKAKLDSGFIYDMWAIVNFSKEFEQKYKYLDKKYYEKFKDLSEKLKKVDFNRLPTSFVHGDIISSNVIKDKENKLWIIDFAVSNYVPRIVDLVVTAYNLCSDPNSKENTVKSLKLIINEYEKYNKLIDYEKEIIPLFFDIGNAMGILQITFLKQDGEYSKEDLFWIKISEQGLKYSDDEFWKEIFSK